MIRRRYLKYIVFLAALLVSVFLLLPYIPGKEQLAAAQSQQKETWPGARELRRQLWRQGELLCVYGTGNSGVVAQYRQYAETVQPGRRVTANAKPDTAVTLADLAAKPALIIGTPASNTWLQRLLPALPFESGADGFAIPGLMDTGKDDILVLSNYPNPVNRSMPLSIILGRSDRAIVAQINNISAYALRGGEFRVFRNGLAIILGSFKQENGGAWQIDLAASRNFAVNESREVTTQHYAVRYHGATSDTTLADVARTQEERLQNMLDHLKVPHARAAAIPRIELHLYASIEDKGLMTGNTDLSHAQYDKWQVHTVYNRDYHGLDFFADAQLLVRHLFGSSKSAILRDGLAMRYSERWGRRGFLEWTAIFQRGNHVDPLPSLLDNRFYARESYLYMRPLAGSFVNFLQSRYGVEQTIAFYRSWPEQGLPAKLAAQVDASDLEQQWLAYLEDDLPAPDSSAPHRYQKNPVFQKGFCHAHEGYQIHNGYASGKSLQALKRLNSLGNTWISITPFGYLSDRNTPEYLRYSFGAGSENDESLIASFYHARELGMGVMLKPHILMRSFNFGWPGEIEMKNAQDWQLFFKYYLSWIRHYAMLAEIYGMDILCVGTELLRTSVPEHEQAWRHIIRQIKHIYRGPLVYAANWWLEYEHIQFWDELDYLGLNCYAPLSDREEVDEATLKAGAQKYVAVIERIARKYDKPVLFTEVGFTSTARNWQEPHKRDRGATPYMDDQVRCYQAIFETFWQQDWCYGFYWWKWPTYVEYGGRDNSGFTPAGKPAEEIVRKWYSKSEPQRRRYFNDRKLNGYKTPNR
jgi:hypothetical protein